MKTVDYINTLIKEKEELKALCKSHVETIRLIKKELSKLNTTITKKDKRILKLENESPNVKIQKELEKVKNELNTLKFFILTHYSIILILQIFVFCFQGV